MTRATALELCAGAGGQALGFEGAGFEHVALMDNDPHSCATLRMNRPYWNVIEADIRRFDASYWQGVDVVAAGLPCPPFSIAGRRLGEDDDRDLFPPFLRIVEETRPRAVLVENVHGLMAPRFLEFRERVQAQLEALGYTVHWNTLNAFDYGAPQQRKRSFVVGVKKGRFAWPQPNGGGGTVGPTLQDLMAARGWRGAAKWAEGANEPAPTIVGGSHKHGGPDLGPTRSRAAWARLGVDGLGLANEAPDPDFRGVPRLTTEMIARLQTFPDEWHIAGSKTQRYRQIGNALPSSLAQAVGRALAECLR